MKVLTQCLFLALMCGLIHSCSPANSQEPSSRWEMATVAHFLHWGDASQTFVTYSDRNQYFFEQGKESWMQMVKTLKFTKHPDDGRESFLQMMLNEGWELIGHSAYGVVESGGAAHNYTNGQKEIWTYKRRR